MLFDFERKVEGVVQNVGELDGLTLGELPGDFRAAAGNLLVDRGRRIKLAVEHNCQLAQAARALALVRDRAGDVRELLRAFLGEPQQNLEAPKLIHGRIGVTQGFAGHRGNALDVILARADLPVPAFLIHGHCLVTGRRLVAGHRLGRAIRIDQTEIEAGGLLQVGNDLRIIPGGNAGELHLDPVVAGRPDNGFSHAEAVDARGDDLNRLGQLLLAVARRGGRGGLFVYFQGERHTALQVEAQLQAPFGALQQLVEEDAVAFLDILERGFEAIFREELGQVELALLANLLERHKDCLSLAGGDPVAGLLHQADEFGRFCFRLGSNILIEWAILERHQFRRCPDDNRHREQQLPEVLSKHWVIWLNSDGAGAWPRLPRQCASPADAGQGLFLLARRLA